MNWLEHILAVEFGFRISTSRGVGPGCMILVVGPSGAGKDTLIARARSACRDHQVVFPRRIITRPSSPAEDHDTVSDDAFDRARADGAFAIWWQAHGLKYAIPLSVDSDIRADRTVVCNVSRTVVEDVRARYAHVIVVMVTAPPEVLAARLAQRERSGDGPVAARVGRVITKDFSPDIVISNTGSIEAATGRFVDLILGRNMAFTL
jgi:ribose 1,5-bisphosphokinase